MHQTFKHPHSEHLPLSCICVKNRYWGSASFWQSSKPDWCGRRSFTGVKPGCASDVLPTWCTVHDSDTHLQHPLVSRKLKRRELHQYQMGWWMQRLLEGHEENADISAMIWERVKIICVPALSIHHQTKLTTHLMSHFSSPSYHGSILWELLSLLHNRTKTKGLLFPQVFSWIASRWLAFGGKTFSQLTYKIWCECSGITLAVLTHVKKQLLCLTEHEWLQLSVDSSYRSAKISFTGPTKVVKSIMEHFLPLFSDDCLLHLQLKCWT
jgi:hypothetical protein